MFFILNIAIALITFFAWMGMRKTNQSGATVVGVVSVVFVLISVSQFFTVVPAGNVGVVIFWGTVSHNTLKAGINFVNPLANVIKMSIQTQEMKEVMDVPSKEGLTVQLMELASNCCDGRGLKPPKSSQAPQMQKSLLSGLVKMGCR